ncbi:MAG: dTDP-4-dehydrorhamnose reductase [Flavobacteriaceae bacterium]
MKKVLITGANGQLGCCLKEAVKAYPEIEFQFLDKYTLDITDASQVASFFKQTRFDYCINTAAYTNVEKAESDKENAFLVNAEGVKNIANACKDHRIILMHISTDYVFDGTQKTPYLETDLPNPINVYGASKRKGEHYIETICEQYFIIRTSWLYSQFGHNFLKSIIRFAKEKKELTITTEQLGTPTNANDLALVLLKIILLDLKEYGMYHFSNSGEATWFDFAKSIIDYSGDSQKVNVVKTDYYPTFAKRPTYSVLNTRKIENLLNFNAAPWQISLKNVIRKL